MKETGIVLELKAICKSFGGTVALNDVRLSIKEGVVHALMGENGAGKSTLMNIIAGVVEADSGEMFFNNQRVSFKTPKDALLSGISMIHQELTPIDELTVAENIFLGREILINGTKIIDYKNMERSAASLLENVGANINPSLQMKNLTVSQIQMVEIAKAISFESKVIIMDEPTSSITNREVERLFSIIKKLKTEGISIVYITHKMEEVFQIADEITVMRDGKYIGTFNSGEIDDAQLIKHMVNQDISTFFPSRDKQIGDKVLEVKGLSKQHKFNNISFSLHKGEILGFSGLIGSGRTEVMESIFGITPSDSGTVHICGNEIKKSSPKKLIKKKVSLITEDRKGSGLVMGMSIRDNALLPSLKKFSKFNIINRKKAAAESDIYIKKLRVKTENSHLDVSSLSGGNQQKVVLAKWLMTEPEIVIFDEPTRGIDIGAKTEIYQMVADLAKNGSAIIYVSSEMPELLGMCDRIIVMNEGVIKGEVSHSEASSELLLSMATNTI